jgi:hypothetical protein
MIHLFADRRLSVGTDANKLKNSKMMMMTVPSGRTTRQMIIKNSGIIKSITRNSEQISKDYLILKQE